ncbi:MAG: DUF2179 domain-containing protein [Peptostreptococcaceae bacterium]|nr:DUF2179 domain-containing protein [Peptostreptococcaceae bacterium]
MEALILKGLYIFLARVIIAALVSIRTILMTKNKKFFSSFIGFFESLLFIVVLGTVMNDLDNIWFIGAYAIGFSVGNYVGIMIEEKIALGELVLRIIVDQREDRLVDELRKNGFGVTVIKGEGRDGERYLLFISLKRRDLNRIYEIIEKNHVSSFICTSDGRVNKGGVFRGRTRH